jgi:DNA-binding transcriptional MerR regulator
VAVEENGFLEYLQLQGGEPDLVTKSELLAEVRKRGFPIGDRQLTFYVSEGLVPRSVRVGSRAGAYPRIVVRLLTWVLRAREAGVAVDAIKELLPIWKFIVSAVNDRRINLGELEYIARSRLTSFEAALAVPDVLTDVLRGHCRECVGQIEIVNKDGSIASLKDPRTTVGFAAARSRIDDETGEVSTNWWGFRREALARTMSYADDPTTVILGLPPNHPLPPPLNGAADGERDHSDREEALSTEHSSQ